jgi:hypothetical protein
MILNVRPKGRMRVNRGATGGVDHEATCDEAMTENRLDSV